MKGGLCYLLSITFTSQADNRQFARLFRHVGLPVSPLRGQGWFHTTGSTHKLLLRNCSVRSESLQLQRLQLAGLLCLWNSPVKNTGVGCHFLLQGIFLTQVPCVSYIGRQILYHWTTWEVHSIYKFHSVQLLSRVRLFATPWIVAHQASLSITNTLSLFKPMSIELAMPSNHLILCRPLLLLPPIPPSIRVFSDESTLHMRWPKYWGFSFSISPSNEHWGLISFRMDWLDLLAVQETLKSLHPYMTTGKTIALTRQIFVGKVMYMLFNRLSRLVITFLPRSKCLLISWLQSPPAAQKK